MKDDKQKIVVGGIYEVELLHRKLPFVICGLHSDTAVRVSNSLIVDNPHTQLMPIRKLGKQIGYDAKYSDEYKRISANAETLEVLIGSCENILAAEKDVNDESSNEAFLVVLVLWQKYKKTLQEYKTRIDELIIEESWMESEVE